MDFSTGPWTWILPSLALTGMLLWFTVALVTRGLEFYRAELEAQRQPDAERAAQGQEVIVTELRRLNARITSDDRTRPVEVPRTRSLR